MNAGTLRVALVAVGSSLAVAVQAAAPAPELRAYVNEACVVADEPWLVPPERLAGDQTSRAVVLAALVVSKLAEVLVSHTINATAGRISAGAQRKDTRYAFARDTNLYRVDFAPQPALALNARLGCITLVAANFSKDANCHQQYQPREPADGFRGRPEHEWRATRTDTSVANVLRRSDICVDGAPRAVYEARFEFSPDGTAWRLVDAGYRVDRLITAPQPRSERNVFYTLEVLQPSGNASRGESLTMGLVSLGKLRAGSAGEEGNGGSGPWLRVPPLGVEARRNYEQRTSLLNETWSQIGALERALKRNDVVAAEVKQRKAAAKGDFARGLAAEEIRLAVQRVTLEAELSARRDEYAALPRHSLEFMPVAIEVGLTETRSEQPGLMVLADVMKQSSGFIASTAGQLASVSRSVDATPSPATHAATEDPGTRLGAARDAWHDARVAQRLAESPEDRAAADAAERRAHEDYATLRRSMGLEELAP